MNMLSLRIIILFIFLTSVIDNDAHGLIRFGSCSQILSKKQFDFLQNTRGETLESLIYEVQSTGLWQEKIWQLQKEKSPMAPLLEGYLSRMLSTAQIIKETPIGIGVSNAVLVEFTNGAKAVMKINMPEKGLFAYSEVAAYRLDQLLDHVNHVPLTVFRKEKEKLYSLQLYIPNAVHYGKRKDTFDYNIRLLDYLTDNTDRKNDNLLVLPNGETVAIDNGLGFRWFYAIKSGVSKSEAWSIKLRNCCARAVFPGISISSAKEYFVRLFAGKIPSSYFQLKAIPENNIQETFADVLPEQEIQNLILRKRFLIEQIESMRK